MSYNRVILMGNLTKDPELGYTPNGAAFCKMTIATSESWKNKAGEKQEKTEFHNVEAWGKQAEVMNQYLSKGKQVLVEGKIKYETYEKDGVKKYFTKVQADTFKFTRDGSQTPKNASSDVSSGDDSSDITVADLPF